MMQALSGILQSRKALMVLVSIVCLTVLVAAGKLDSKQFLDFLMVTLPVWLGAQGLEDAAEKYNPVKPDATPSAILNVSASLDPHNPESLEQIKKATEAVRSHPLPSSCPVKGSSTLSRPLVLASPWTWGRSAF